MVGRLVQDYSSNECAIAQSNRYLSEKAEELIWLGERLKIGARHVRVEGTTFSSDHLTHQHQKAVVDVDALAEAIANLRKAYDKKAELEKELMAQNMGNLIRSD